MSEWKPYVGNRLFIERVGYCVIKPCNCTNEIPLSCPICGSLLRTNDDEQSISEFGCCDRCAMRWVHPDRERWKNGWRPSEQDVNAELMDRPGLSITIK